MEQIGNFLENNHITGFTFEGVNPVTEIWQQINDNRESSLTFSNNQQLTFLLGRGGERGGGNGLDHSYVVGSLENSEQQFQLL